MKKIFFFFPSRRGVAGESGNVLFLILIAVALFAALSYAVTQSSRSGGGDANAEKSIVSGAEITQYPAGVRTSVVRMMISTNKTADELYFDPPAAFSGNSPVIVAADYPDTVFYPTGGGATYQSAPSDVMNTAAGATNKDGTWYFNALFQIPNIGTTSASDNSGNDLIAFLPDVKQSVCQKIDDSLGLPSIPVLSAAATSASLYKSQVKDTADATHDTTFPANNSAGESFANEISGQPFGCFENASGGIYVYYHTLLER